MVARRSSAESPMHWLTWLVDAASARQLQSTRQRSYRENTQMFRYARKQTNSPRDCSISPVHLCALVCLAWPCDVVYDGLLLHSTRAEGPPPWPDNGAPPERWPPTPLSAAVGLPLPVRLFIWTVN